MVEKLVALHNEEPRVSTFDIFKDLGYSEHRLLKKIVTDHGDKFKTFGLIQLELHKPKKGSKGGRPDKSFLLNEDQFTLLIMLCKNNPKTVDLKVKIARQFVQMKKMLIKIKTQQQNASWIENRKSGKISRNAETDIIKEFIEYAKEQGSTSPDRYYGNFTRMENASLFIITQKFKNIRDILDGQQLAVISACDQIVSKAIRDGMMEEMFYKDIFQEAKKDVLKFVGLIGTTYVPSQKTLSND